MSTYQRVVINEVTIPGKFLAWQNAEKFIARNATDDEINLFFDGSYRNSICGISTVLGFPGESINMLIEGHLSCPTS